MTATLARVTPVDLAVDTSALIGVLLGEPSRPHETSQFVTIAPPLGPDVHFFRQDIDAYMLAVAIERGAEVRQQVRLAEVEIDADGVVVTLEGGERIAASYVVDAGGIQSPLARKFALRESPCPLRTRSRTLYTHMVGVLPIDACGLGRAEHGLPSPLSQGTLHHIFDGGWLWVIPFDNHPASRSRLCSVGLNLALDRHPPTGEAPEREFARLLARFPTIGRQFARARPVRNFTAIDRLQFSSTRLVGDRYCLLPHAAAFVDPMFSSGLMITVISVNAIAHRLLAAARDGDFSAARFAFVDTWTKRMFAHFDRLVSCSYLSFADFELWNAWQRLWMLGSFYGATGLFSVLGAWEEHHRQEAFELLEEKPLRGLQAIDFEPYAKVFAAAAEQVEATRAGRPTAAAIAAIYDLLRGSALAPGTWDLGDPAMRCPAQTLTLLPALRMVRWGRHHSPEPVRSQYFASGRVDSLLLRTLRDSGVDLGRHAAIAGGFLRDILLSWNGDWRQRDAASDLERR
jgi:FADH2 O2-dependent halogenase